MCEADTGGEAQDQREGSVKTARRTTNNPDGIASRIYFPARISDRDPHYNRNGTEKRRWPNRTSARFIADFAAFKRARRAPHLPSKFYSVYFCSRCDGYHTGTARDLNRHHRRIVDREPDLLYELGPRATRLLLSESSGAHWRREASISARTAG